MTRWPTATCWRGVPTSPRHAAASIWGSSWLAPPAPAATESRVAVRASPPSTPSCGASRRRRRIRIDRKITSEGDLLNVATGGGDHRRVVRAQLERGERGAGSDARSSEFAATPPTTAICSAPTCSAAAFVLSTSARTMARWYEAARSARRRSSSSSPSSLHLVEQRSLEAREREVEPRHPRDGEVERLGVALLRKAVDRSTARVAEAEEPRPLSNASPAASSRVVPRTSNPAWSCTSRRSVWPPLARRQRNGGCTSSGDRKSEATWPWRWSTGTSGSRSAHASAFAAESPTRSAPIKPGPARDGDPLDVRQLRARLAERLADDRRDQLEVPP